MDTGDRMFCHACGGVWLRNNNGLSCPHCQSDFTEIIEIPPDPDEQEPFPDPPEAAPGDDHLPSQPSPPTNPWANHNPWASDDSYNSGNGNGNGFRHHTYRSPDGRFTFSSTSYTSGFGSRGPPRQQPGEMPQNDPLMPLVRGLDTIFHGFADTYRNQGGARRASTGPDAGVGPWQTGDPFRHTFDFDMHSDIHHGMHQRGDTGHGQHDPGLHPRDADGPQPNTTPLRTLGDVLELFRADFGGNGHPGGVRVMTGPNPLAMLSTLLSFDRHGDAVYSQEELDRVISQLVDQNVNRTAPPPASQNAIHSLPKKKVDDEMLGKEGKAECSICMDPVEKGTEVTVLPCKHWFHFNCIEMWLNQHNTCPHCRRPIDSAGNGNSAGASADNPVVIDDGPGPSSGRRRSSGGRQGSVQSDQRRSSREGQSGGGIAGWVRSHFGGGS